MVEVAPKLTVTNSVIVPLATPENTSWWDKWIPERKFFASGIAGILAWCIITFSGLVGQGINEKDAISLASGIMLVVHLAAQYMTKPSFADTLKRIDAKFKSILGQELPKIQETRLEVEIKKEEKKL